MRTILWSLATALVVPILLLGVYFVHGSFEYFPTDERQSTIRIVSGAGLFIFALLEALVVVALLRFRPKP